MPLEKEQETYARNLQSLLASVGKFVLIKGDQITGVFDTYSDALKAGYEKFGLEQFFVKQIQAVERAHFFTRDPSACRI